MYEQHSFIYHRYPKPNHNKQTFFLFFLIMAPNLGVLTLRHGRVSKYPFLLSKFVFRACKDSRGLCQHSMTIRLYWCYFMNYFIWYPNWFYFKHYLFMICHQFCFYHY
jgi:hypothetical protein